MQSSGSPAYEPSDVDDTALYDAGRPPESEETDVKHVDSDTEDMPTPVRPDHHAVNGPPVQLRRPAQVRRQPAPYRD